MVWSKNGSGHGRRTEFNPIHEGFRDDLRLVIERNTAWHPTAAGILAPVIHILVYAG
jgi:hypothetical protein